ncbi:hypothetical protein ABWK29_15205 [Priestia megaterium]|uniref:hypothetical protein n=1 Tax=Priestia megaterium TaxID=1404 RepID=UPI000BF659C6|nr:hypothetical protein [Priestia megaterium]RFB37252.1 hypothetical protein DZB86_19025 [Bacillus sp. RC]PFO17250.1 hypothetical protein COJ70_13275 [Priestia megaterium]PFV99486.1 hypothetical protein COL08_09585 [Priestia megaterium]PGT69153.1 hypothetical protein COD15_17885 [Priestia megaterium]RBN36570.1 hypothetical protein DMN50_34860 [Priestia megaterium]
MSSYHEYMAEREKIDFLLQKGFKITAVTENLSGAFVTFERTGNNQAEQETLHILTADARKYFSSVLIQQV